MELASKYNPADVEGKWYQYWLDHKLFSSKPDGREPYTVVIPPPNVTGVLHMGHMLNNTIQDILKTFDLTVKVDDDNKQQAESIEIGRAHV